MQLRPGWWAPMISRNWANGLMVIMSLVIMPRPPKEPQHMVIQQTIQAYQISNQVRNNKVHHLAILQVRWGPRAIILRGHSIYLKMDMLPIIWETKLIILPRQIIQTHNYTKKVPVLSNMSLQRLKKVVPLMAKGKSTFKIWQVKMHKLRLRANINKILI